VDFFEDAVTSREKEGAIEEMTSGERIYQACLDLEQATAREVFQHINPDITKPAVPLSTLKNKTTELKSAGLVEEVDKDGNAPIYAPVECPGGTREDRPTGPPTTYTDDDVTISRQGSDGEGEKIPPSTLTSIVRGVEKPTGGEVPMPLCYALESYDGYRVPG
jgi:hypothetical protein